MQSINRIMTCPVILEKRKKMKSRNETGESFFILCLGAEYLWSSALNNMLCGLSCYRPFFSVDTCYGWISYPNLLSYLSLPGNRIEATRITLENRKLADRLENMKPMTPSLTVSKLFEESKISR